jgi:hypothetical protein
VKNQPQNADKKAMRLGILGIFFSFIYSLGWAQSALYRWDPQTKLCQPVSAGLKARAATTVKNFPQIESKFVKDNPSCEDAPTCLTSDRMQRLIFNNEIPRGAVSQDFLKSEFKNKAAKACVENETAGGVRSVQDVLDVLNRDQKTYPIETKMAYQLVEKTKAIVDENLKASDAGMENLKKCLKPEGAGLEACKIFQKDSDAWKLLEAQQKQKRLAVMALNLLSSKNFKEESSLERLADSLGRQEMPSPEARALLSAPMSLNQAGLRGLFQGAFFDDNPDTLVAPSDSEKRVLATYLKVLKKNYKGLPLEEALKADYFASVSETPILSYLDGPDLNSAQLLKALEKHQAKWKENSKAVIEDMDYLNFPQALETALDEMDPAQRGDYCVLAEFMTRSRREHYHDTPEKVLTMFTLAEGGVAAQSAKGLVKKGFAMLAGVNISGGALVASGIEKSMATYSQQRRTCAANISNSKGLCDVNKLGQSYDYMATSLAAYLVFGSKKVKALAVPLLLAPAAKSSSSGK